MNNRNLINLLLLIIIVTLGTIAYLRPGLQEPETKTLTELSVADINRISLKTTTNTIQFEKQDDNWWIAGKPRRLADELQLEQLTDIARTIPARSYPASELSRDKIGLSADSPTLSLNDISFTIGNTDPLNNLRYLQQDEHVYLIRDTLANYIAAKKSQFVSRNLFPDNTSIKHIDLADFDTFSADQRNDLLQHWETAQAIWVRSYKTDSAWQQNITITFDDDSQADYQLRYDDDDMVLGRKDWGIEYHMGNDATRQLLVSDSTAEDTK